MPNGQQAILEVGGEPQEVSRLFREIDSWAREQGLAIPIVGEHPWIPASLLMSEGYNIRWGFSKLHFGIVDESVALLIKLAFDRP